MGTLASSQREAQEQELIKATNQIAELKQELREVDSLIRVIIAVDM